jgi:MFS family permease
MIILSYSLPGVVIGPLAGALIDRLSRRHVMLLSSVGAAVCTLSMFSLLYVGRLQDWQIVLAVSGISICNNAFQWPAYLAANTLLLPKEKFSRGSALVQLAQAIQLIVSPSLAILLLEVIPIRSLMAVDFLTYIFFAVILLLIEIPAPAEPALHRERGPFFVELASGWDYIRTRPGLFPLLVCFTSMIFAGRMIQVLILPLVLGISSPVIFAVVSAVASFGMAAGSIAIAIWGGPRRRVHGLFAGGALTGMVLILAGLAPSALLVGASLFVAGLAIPLGMNSDDVIWQRKTHPGIQGRVFAIRVMASGSCLPAACIAAGLLVDRVFRPLLMPQGLLASTLGRLSGVGPARGAGLFLALTGLVTLVVTTIVFSLPSVRQIEDGLPDVTQADLTAALAETREEVPEYQSSV